MGKTPAFLTDSGRTGAAGDARGGGLPTAIVHPCPVEALAAAQEARDEGCQNAVDLLLVMGVATRHVTVLVAVETVTPAMPATLDAAALTVLALRGQIIGARVDGPLAFDNAISLDVARTHRLRRGRQRRRPAGA